MHLFDTPAEREVPGDIPENISEEIKEKLLFQKAVLVLLKETSLFNCIIEQAIEDVDFVIEKMDRLI